MARGVEAKSNVTVWLLAGGFLLATVAGIVLMLSYWFKPPVVAISNLKYLQLLRTSVSSQNADHVKKVEGALKTLREKGDVSEPEWEHFQSIITQALAGNWQAADRACKAWEDSQANRERAPGDHADAHHHSRGAKGAASAKGNAANK